MSGSLTKRFVEKSRADRRAELSRDPHTNLGLVFGLSSQFDGLQAHIDYVGRLDTNKIWAGLAKLAKPARLEVKFNDEKKVAEEKILPSLKDALADAAPIDLYQETVVEQKRKSQRKHREFAGILSQIDKTAIASFALNIMQSRHRRTTSPLQVPLVRGPSFGSAHVFYTIEFYDTQNRQATKWIIKIPVNGTPDVWDRLCAETLRTEALVLYMLRMETTIPVPAIIDADSSPHSEIHVPYVLMEYVVGRPLDRVWFGEGVKGGDEGTIREMRAKILRNLARIMLELGKYEFEAGGAPVFDVQGTLVGVGPLRELDVQAMVQRWLRNEDCEKAPVYAEVGPFEDAAEMYGALLDLHPCNDEASLGVDKLLRLLIRFVREPSKTRPLGPEEERRDKKKEKKERKERKKKKEEKKKEKDFVLTHPDLNFRNILVSKEGRIEAILGWDGVRAAPKSVGNEALPRWLVRDFNPFVWRWQPAAELWRKSGFYEEEERNKFEDAPWVLRELRSEYANTIYRKKKRRADVDMGVDVTRQSLLALSLDTAVRDPRCRSAILRRILEKCSRISEEFDFDRVVEILGSGRRLDGYKLKCLERNFRELVDRGYVRGAVVW